MLNEGMVDALHRIHHFLDAAGVLIDLHPTVEPARLELATPEGDLVTAGMLNAEEVWQRHANADSALARVVDQGLFVVERTREFSFRRYADSVTELAEYVATKWTNARFDDETIATARAAHRPGCRAWLREQVRIAKLTPGAQSATDS
jgi:hypothetical protein